MCVCVCVCVFVCARAHLLGLLRNDDSKGHMKANASGDFKQLNLGLLLLLSLSLSLSLGAGPTPQTGNVINERFK